MRKSALVRLAVVLLIAASLVIIVGQERTARRLRAELASWRRQQMELTGLRAENRNLTLPTTKEEMKRLREAEAEIARLKTLTEAKRTRAAKPTAESVPAGAWKLAGRETPRAAFETVLWAATHQEIDTLAGLLNFDDKTRAQMDAFFAKLPEETRAQYGAPEKIVATMLAANMPADLSATTELGDATSQDAATLLMRVDRGDGTQKSTYFKFQLGTDGWQLLVPPNVLRDYERELTNTSVPVPEALANGQKP